MPKLRTAIIGLGMMGANHARVLSNLDGVELVAVADPQGDAQKVLPQIKVLNSVEEVIKLGVDYCVISAPTVFHEEIALQLIANKIHFLVEKPIADTYASAVKIRDAAKSANVIGAVGHIERFNSALQEARKRVLAGELGTIYQVATRRQGPFPSRISDVGVVKDLATHDIDLTSWITGKKYLQVSANAAFRSGREHEDLISVSGLLEDSIVVSHLVNWLSPLKERKIIITGEKGTFVADTLRADLTFYENGKIEISQSELAHFRGVTQGDVHILAFEKPEPLVVEHQNFRDAVLGKPSNIVSLEEGTTTVKIADAIIESYTNEGLVKL
jgi:UDP-N-acetylglucosamine 3-dehydrogenase